jgi:hypothetical protein
VSGWEPGSVETKRSWPRRGWVASCVVVGSGVLMMLVPKGVFDVDFDVGLVFVACAGLGNSLVARCGA